MRSRLLTFLILLLLSLACAEGVAGAELQYYFGATGTGLEPSDDRIDGSYDLSLDFVFDATFRAGVLTAYVETSTTPEDFGAATLLPETNTDAGTALDEEGRRRIQISELKFRFTFGQGRGLVVGLLNPTAYLDASAIAGDENTQFLGVSFVQNPIIEFPDYTLGVLYEHPMGGPWNWRFAATASDGLADNPNLGFGDLLEREEAEGVFLAASASRRTAAWTLRVGGWFSSADHLRLDGAANEGSSYGLYLVTDAVWGGHGINVRAGVAPDEVSKAPYHVAAVYRRAWERDAVGAGLAYTWVSPVGRGSEEDDLTHAELYYRHRFGKDFFLTPSVQYVRNSRFDASGSVTDQTVLLAVLRVSYQLRR